MSPENYFDSHTRTMREMGKEGVEYLTVFPFAQWVLNVSEREEGSYKQYKLMCMLHICTCSRS